MEEQRGSREKAIYTELLRKPRNFFPSFELFPQIIHPCIYLHSKKDLDIPAQNHSGEKVLQEISTPGSSPKQGQVWDQTKSR